MSASITTLLIASLLGPLPAAMAKGDLFSEIAVESVFETKEETTAEQADLVEKPKASEIARIAGAGPLTKLLNEAGLKAELQDGSTVTVLIEHRSISRNATLKVAVDRDLIEIRMPLKQLTEGELDMARIMKLMEPDSELPGASFGLQNANQVVEIRYSVGNRSLSAGRLLSVLQSLVELIERRQPAVLINPTPATSPVSNGTVGSIGLAEQPNTEARLPIGTWVAKRGTKEAFALEITPSSQFKLVHIKATRASSSIGTASLTGDQLAFQASEGMTIQVTLLSQTEESFRIELNGRRIAFKTAK